MENAKIPPATRIHSVTADDCEWDFSRGSGKGGQKRNKTSTKARCKHPPSGAIGVSDDTRDQHKNKRAAFLRMIATKEFQAWHKLEIARITGAEAQMRERVERAMRPGNLKVEGKDEHGRWSEDAILVVENQP